MLRNLILFSLVLLALPSFGKKVQFNVNFANNPAFAVPTAAGAHIMGDFQMLLGAPGNYDPGYNPMVQDAVDTNIWRLTVDLPAHQKYEFIFLFGDQSYEIEVPPVESQVGYNFNEYRWFYLDSISTDTLKLPAIIFGANAPTGYYLIRMLVDMQNENVSPNGVHIAGGYQGSNPASDQCYSFIPNVYEEIGYMLPGMQHYKFVNGNTNADAESVTGSCAMGNMRMITASQDIILGKACFGSCDTCLPVGVSELNLQEYVTVYPNPVTTQFEIQFTDASSTYHHVAIADMNGKILRKHLYKYGSRVVLQRENLTSGMYQLLVMDDRNHRGSMKLMID